MTVTKLTEEGRDANRGRMLWFRTIALGALAPALLAGCVQVTAPDRPIVIDLNINIRQEVIVRLQQDVRELIEENEEIF